MKHRGPAASLNPSRESARRSARAAVTTIAAGGPPPRTGPEARSAASPPAVVVGAWLLTTDQHGRLVAADRDGTRHVLATPNTSEGDA